MTGGVYSVSHAEGFRLLPGFGVSPPSPLGEEVELSVCPLADGPVMGGRPRLAGGLTLPALWCINRESNLGVTEPLLLASAAMCQLQVPALLSGCLGRSQKRASAG